MMLLGIQADLEGCGNTKLVNTGPCFLWSCSCRFVLINLVDLFVNHNTNHKDFEMSSSRVKQNWIGLSGEISAHAHLDSFGERLEKLISYLKYVGLLSRTFLLSANDWHPQSKQS